MVNSGLNDSLGNPIVQESHYLFSIPDNVFGNFNALFYNSNLGKEMKELSAKHMLVYVMPTKYLIVNLSLCMLDENKNLITIEQKERLCNYDAKMFTYDGIDIETVDKNLPYISSSEDSFTFLRYLLCKNTFALENKPVIDLAIFNPLLEN